MGWKLSGCLLQLAAKRFVERKYMSYKLLESLACVVVTIVLWLMVLVLFSFCGCGGNGSRLIRHDLQVVLYLYGGSNSLSYFEALKAWNLMAVRWEQQYGEKITLVNLLQREDSVEYTADTDSEQELTKFTKQIDQSIKFYEHARHNVVHIGILPAARIGNEQIYSGGRADYWTSTAVINVGNRLTKSRVGVERAAALLKHEAGHLRGLTDSEIVD